MIEHFHVMPFNRIARGRLSIKAELFREIYGRFLLNELSDPRF